MTERMYHHGPGTMPVAEAARKAGLVISPWAGHARAYIRDGRQTDLDAMLAAPLPSPEEQGRVLAPGAWRTHPVGVNVVQPRLSEPRPRAPVLRLALALGCLAGLVWALAGLGTLMVCLVIWALLGCYWHGRGAR